MSNKEYTPEQLALLAADGWTFKENADPTKPGVWLHPVRGKKLKDSLRPAPVHVSALPPIQDTAAVDPSLAQGGEDHDDEQPLDGQHPPAGEDGEVEDTQPLEEAPQPRRDHEHRIIKD